MVTTQSLDVRPFPGVTQDLLENRGSAGMRGMQLSLEPTVFRWRKRSPLFQAGSSTFAEGRFWRASRGQTASAQPIKVAMSRSVGV